MTRYIRGAQAYGAVSAPIAQNASPEITDLRNLNAKAISALGFQRGSSQRGRPQAITARNERYLALTDAEYAAWLAAGVDLSTVRYNDVGPPSGDTFANIGEVPPAWNPGLHRQVIVMSGNSIGQLTIGSGVIMALTQPRKRTWARGFVPGMEIVITPDADPRFNYLPSSAPRGGEYAYTLDTANSRSRMIHNYCRNSNREVNYPSYTYTQGYNWANSIAQVFPFPLHPSQKGFIHLFCDTSNDIDYADSPNSGMNGAPTGTAGAAFAGTPNVIDDVRKVFLPVLASVAPGWDIGITTNLARLHTGNDNAKFNDEANWLKANFKTDPAFNQVKIVLDAREIKDANGNKVFDCRQNGVTQNRIYYQQSGDETHITDYGADVLDPYFQAMYDWQLGYPIPSAMASAFTY